MRHLHRLRPSVLRGVPASARERRLLWGAALALIGYVLMVWGAETSTRIVDEAARDAVQFTRHPLLHRLMADVSRLGAVEGLLGLIAVGSVGLWRLDRCWALVLPALMAGTGALQFLTKWSVDRPRPNLEPWGFPSGHVLSLVVFFGLLAYLGWGGSRRRRRLIAVMCAVPIVVVAYSRLYLDKHWLTDLAGGFTVGLAYLLLVILVVEVTRARRSSPERLLPRQ